MNSSFCKLFFACILISAIASNGCDAGENKPAKEVPLTQASAEEEYASEVSPVREYENTFAEMKKLQKYMNKLFDFIGENKETVAEIEGRSYSPGIDVYATDSTVVVECDLPGMDKGSINVDVSGQVLTISGQREKEEQTAGNKEGFDYYQKGVSRGRFTSTVTLPESADLSRYDATYVNGVLKITFQKKKGEAAKRLKINIR